MIRLNLPSIMRIELNCMYIEVDINCINDLKKIEMNETIKKLIFNEDREFNKNIRFILNNELLNVDEYEKIIQSDDEITLIFQFIGG